MNQTKEYEEELQSILGCRNFGPGCLGEAARLTPQIRQSESHQARSGMRQTIVNPPPVEDLPIGLLGTEGVSDVDPELESEQRGVYL